VKIPSGPHWHFEEEQRGSFRRGPAATKPGARKNRVAPVGMTICAGSGFVKAREALAMLASRPEGQPLHKDWLGCRLGFSRFE
jgi:hypothetical protein